MKEVGDCVNENYFIKQFLKIHDSLRKSYKKNFSLGYVVNNGNPFRITETM